MKGTIRTIAGILIVFGSVGGIETSITNVELLGASVTAIIGLALMYSGVKAINPNAFEGM
jgi:hypothetical protein